MRQRSLLKKGDRLPAVLAGTDKPSSAGEQIEFAEFCALQKLHSASARFYRDAFAADPRLAERVDARYQAACAAALAGTGQGKDVDKLDDNERASWRRQALDWLKADLALWGKRAAKDEAKAREALWYELKHWQTAG